MVLNKRLTTLIISIIREDPSQETLQKEKLLEHSDTMHHVTEAKIWKWSPSWIRVCRCCQSALSIRTVQWVYLVFTVLVGIHNKPVGFSFKCIDEEDASIQAEHGRCGYHHRRWDFRSVICNSWEEKICDLLLVGFPTSTVDSYLFLLRRRNARL